MAAYTTQEFVTAHQFRHLRTRSKQTVNYLLRTFSYAAFCLFIVGCLLEIFALLGFNSLALLGATGSDDGRWFLIFGIPFFIFWLPLFFLQFVPPYREAIRGGQQCRFSWMSGLLAACVVGWFAGMVWMSRYWDGGGPEIRNGHLVLWLKGSNQFLPISAAEYQHDMAIFARIMMTWVIAAFLTIWSYFDRAAQLTSDL